MLAGKRILLVEDEYLIAADIKAALLGADASVVGPAGRLDDGLSLLSGEALDGAVLDVNLGGQSSYAIADALRARDVPFVLVTGYDAWSIPEGYRDAPRLAKPFAMRRVVETLTDLIGESK